MNLHDAERIAGLLKAEGWRESGLEEADAVILLTCCVRESAERRLFGRLSAIGALKKNRPLTIAVGGCLAQREGLNLMHKAPYVDLVFGTHQYPHIAHLLQQSEGGGVCSTAMERLDLSHIPCQPRDEFRSWVTITQGCDNYCSYCVVPFVRGRETSRSMDDVLEEVGRHVSRGSREINLLGQNVNSYRRKEEGRSRFADLLRLVGEGYPEVWVRFMTSHPRDFDTRIMQAIAANANVCEYVHLPLQSGSDSILEGMNRGYTREEYLGKAIELRDAVHDVCLTTDIIVGFPGESTDDFEDTLEMVMRCRFDAAFTFVYNPREETAAAHMPDEVSVEAKRERMDRLVALTDDLTAASLRTEVGREREALVYGCSRKDPRRWAARTRRNRLVHFERKDDDLTGRFVRLSIISAGNWSLQGELIEVLA